jgi:hypothetical protein
MKKLFYSFLLVSVALALQISCSEDEPAPTPKSTATDILSFTITDQTGAATIDATSHTVAVEVANGTARTALTPTFTLSTGATASPATGTEGDYSSAKTITVTAEDGTTTQAWTVTVTEAAPGPSTATDILTFSITGQTSLTGDADAHTIDVEVANGTNLGALTADFSLSAGATSVPATGATEDYTNPVIITVTAEDNTTTQPWTVTVTAGTAELSSENDVLTFIITEQTGDAAVIDATNKWIEVDVIAGTNLSALTPTYTLSTGATGAGVVNDVANDFSTDRTLLVTAEDGTEQNWKVRVHVDGVANSGANILTFTMPEQTGNATINDTEHTVAIEVANGTSLAALTPTFTISTGASSSPVSETEGNYSSDVTITVTAEDATPQDWTVTVTVAEATTTEVLFDDGGTKATRITDLVVDGVTYDVAFVDSYPSQIYDEYPGTYTFTSTGDAATAMDAMNSALQGSIATVTGPQGGTEEDAKYRIGFEGQTAGLEFCNFAISRYSGTSWAQESDDSAQYNNFFPTLIYAVFTEK